MWNVARQILGLNVNNAISLALWLQQEPLANGFGLCLQVVKEDGNWEFICCDDKSGYEYQGEWGLQWVCFQLKLCYCLFKFPL